MRATDDKFIIVVETGETTTPKDKKALNVMKEHGAVEVMNKEFESVKG
jgi:hypothetical protein